ncbi:MAG: hypothetical protein WDW38_006386 [Sanguina aurantia]
MGLMSRLPWVGLERPSTHLKHLPRSRPHTGRIGTSAMVPPPFVLYKNPVAVVQFLHSQGHDARPSIIVERNHPRATEFKLAHPSFRINDP